MSNIAAAGKITIADLGEVTRLGFGAMRITGPGVWGEPADPAAARQLLNRVVDVGVDFIDTADSYGPEVSERLIAEALHPYSPGLRIGTKAGQARPGPHEWVPLGRAEYLRQQVELSLRRLRVDALDVFQLHRVDPKVEVDEQFGVMADLQREGKVRALGLSEVTVEQIERAGEYFTVATVQNRYNLADRRHEDVLEHCTRHGIAFIPWAPLAAGELTGVASVVGELADRLQAQPSQVALAWLLQRSPMMLPIPGTSSITHLEANVAAAGLHLDEEAVAELDAVGTNPPA